MQRARVLLTVVALILGLGVAGCGETSPTGIATITGSGHLRSETRTARDVSAVDLVSVGTVTISQGTSEGVQIVAEDNLLPLIQTTVDGGRLRLGFADEASRIVPTKPIAFVVSVRHLDDVTLSGLGHIDVPHLTTGVLAVTVSGSGQVTLHNLSAQTLTTHMTGAGALMASGRVERQSITIAGSGTYNGADLASTEATVAVPGAGTAVVRVSARLRTEISGAGHVEYIGAPQVEQRVTGVGTIVKRA